MVSAAEDGESLHVELGERSDRKKGYDESRGACQARVRIPKNCLGGFQRSERESSFLFQLLPSFFPFFLQNLSLSCTIYSLRMTTEYPEHFLERPTPEQLHELAQIQRRAEADPLETGHVLDWMGPQLEDGAPPPTDYPHNRSPSPNPLRPLHSILVDPQLGPSASPWTLTLVEALQVWRARATSGGDTRRAFSVVVKLYHQALFPPPEPRDSRAEYDSWNWYSATYKQEREALVYRSVFISRFSRIELS